MPADSLSMLSANAIDVAKMATRKINSDFLVKFGYLVKLFRSKDVFGYKLHIVICKFMQF